MVPRILLNNRRLAFKRFQSQSALESSKSAFDNKFKFNINPPPIHEYWNARNNIVLLAFVPIFLGVGYVTKYVGANLGGYGGLLDAANDEQSSINGESLFESQKSAHK